MKTNLFNFKHHTRTGPGGWRCTCCGVPPSSRHVMARRHKKRLYKLLDRFERDAEKV